MQGGANINVTRMITIERTVSRQIGNAKRSWRLSVTLVTAMALLKHRKEFIRKSVLSNEQNRDLVVYVEIVMTRIGRSV